MVRSAGARARGKIERKRKKKGGRRGEREREREREGSAAGSPRRSRSGSIDRSHRIAENRAGLPETRPVAKRRARGRERAISLSIVRSIVRIVICNASHLPCASKRETERERERAQDPETNDERRNEVSRYPVRYRSNGQLGRWMQLQLNGCIADEISLRRSIDRSMVRARDGPLCARVNNVT